MGGGVLAESHIFVLRDAVPAVRRVVCATPRARPLTLELCSSVTSSVLSPGARGLHVGLGCRPSRFSRGATNQPLGKRRTTMATAKTTAPAQNAPVTANAPVPSNRPTHLIYSVRSRGDEKKSSWTEIGVAFTNRDGSLNLIFNALPIDGRCCLRVNEVRPTDA
jgi:hypothetical protein